MNNVSLSIISLTTLLLATASHAAEERTPLPLAELHLPAEPSSWPLAWGWWALGALILILLITIWCMISRHKKRHKSKKAALKLLKLNLARLENSKNRGQKRVAAANDLLRQVCLSYYPRAMLASVSGERWYQFLDAQSPSNNNSFQANAQQWQACLYQNQDVSDEVANKLCQQVEDWITQSLPPSKKQMQTAQETYKQASSDLNDGIVSAARPANKAPKALIEKERVLTELAAKNMAMEADTHKEPIDKIQAE
ncbi:MAG: DUF4381 domain-containing protein [Vibrio sp.]